MNEKKLELLERIKDTLSEIQDLREDLGDLLGNPDVTLENLGRLHDIPGLHRGKSRFPGALHGPD